MIFVAPRSAKLVESQGSRYTLLTGLRLRLIGSWGCCCCGRKALLTGGRPRLCLPRDRGRVRRDPILPLAGGSVPVTAGRDGLGHRGPPARPGRRNHAVDLRGAAHRGLRLGGERGIAASPQADQVSDSMQGSFTRSFASAANTRARPTPQYADGIIAGGKAGIPRRRPVGLPGRHDRRAPRGHAGLLHVPPPRRGASAHGEDRGRGRRRRRGAGLDAVRPAGRSTAPGQPPPRATMRRACGIRPSPGSSR